MLLSSGTGALHVCFAMAPARRRLWGRRIFLLRRTMHNRLCHARDVQALPSCAWSVDDGTCPPFAVGQFAIGVLGYDACPSGSHRIGDWAACQSAATQLGKNWDITSATEGECIWCGGCGGAVLLKSTHGYLAKWICQVWTCKPRVNSYRKISGRTIQEFRRRSKTHRNCKI